MILSLNWLKSMVDIDDFSAEEIVKRLTLSTAEVEGFTKVGDDMQDVVVAKVETCEKLANSNHLNLLSVNDGSGEMLQVVTGAPNVYAGMKTALVRVGGMVNGIKIKKAKLAGTDSYGMCCSEAELKIGSDDEGIVDFTNTDYAIGTDLKSIFPIEDVLIEIDNKSLTNRPDLWGHLGFARELSAIFNRKLKPIDLVNISKFDGLRQLPIKLQTPACLRYTGVMIDNVTVKRSPYEIKIRLNYCGLRDINLLADLTNYVMLELGTPMHAFDKNMVDGIIVREAFDDEELLTLEGETHKIAEGSIIVCDRHNNPVAIAGIKGGMQSGITDETTGFLLESAVFEASKIRKASKAIGLTTDSSIRYEKSLDPEFTPKAIARVISLLKNIDSGIVVTSEVTDVINYDRSTIEINLNTDFVRDRIGENVSNEFIFDTLSKLGFTISNINGNDAIVEVPSFRATKDISIKEDLVEEIARMYGYDNVKAQPMMCSVEPVSQSPKHIAEYKVKRLLAEKYDFNEVHTYVWNYADFNNSIGISSPSYVNLVDSSNSGQSGIRSELVPSLLQVINNNKNIYDEIKIDEIGRVITGLNADKSSVEEKHIAICYYSSSKSEMEIYFYLKKIVLNIAESLAKTTVNFDASVNKDYLFDAYSCGLVVNGNLVGHMGLLHPMVSSKIDKKAKIGVVEIDYDKFMNFDNEQKVYHKVSKFQSVDLDFNFLVPTGIKFAELADIINKFRCKFEFNFKLKDIYDNKELFGDKKSMTFAFNVCAIDHTLTSNEIDNFSRRLVEHMKNNNINLR